MLWFIYNILFAVGYTLLLPKHVLHMRKRGGYRRDFMQRLAIYAPEVTAAFRPGERIWMHAVSVGEVQVALRLIRAMRQADPDAAFLLSTTSSTGHAVASADLDAADVLIYFPVDFPWVVRRALSRIRPRALILIEGELWPNMIRHAHARGIPVILANGRLSAASYRRYRRIRAFIGPVLGQFDLLCVQTGADGDRLRALGAAADRVQVIGSTKYDVADPAAEVDALAQTALRAAGMPGDSNCLVGGSTWAGEEALLMAAYKNLRTAHRDLRLVLVPRHAERRHEVIADIEAAGLTFACRSLQSSADEAPADAPAAPPDVLLVDTTGEIMSFYAIATVIVVGKSLLHRGGQNIIEPALFGKPVIVGPNMENFPGVMADFLAAGAMIQLADPAELEAAIAGLLGDPGRRAEVGRRARAVVEEKRGAVDATAAAIVALIAGRRRR